MEKPVKITQVVGNCKICGCPIFSEWFQKGTYKADKVFQLQGYIQAKAIPSCSCVVELGIASQQRVDNWIQQTAAEGQVADDTVLDEEEPVELPEAPHEVDFEEAKDG